MSHNRQLPWRQACCGGQTVHGSIECRTNIAGNFVCKCTKQPSLNYPLLYRLGVLVNQSKVHLVEKDVVKQWQKFVVDVVFEDSAFADYNIVTGAAIRCQFEKVWLPIF